MAIPEPIEEVLAERLHEPLPGILGVPCGGSKYHTPRPMITYPFTCKDGTRIALCGTCKDNLTLLNALERDEPLPWKVRRLFGNLIRALAKWSAP